MELPITRLFSQNLVESRARTPLEVVSSLGALQAQDYGSAVWAIGCRIPGSAESEIEQAIRDATILRTWPMRGTLHFVPAVDACWMLTLLTPRVIAGTTTRVRQLELDDATFAKAERVLLKALEGRRLSREKTLLALEHAGISTKDGRGYHILFRLSMQGLLCCGPREGKQQTFVLLHEWVTKKRRLEGEVAIAELARRYFTGHGPATAQDFAWWSGLKMSDVKAALVSIGSELHTERIERVEYWMSKATLPKLDAGVQLLAGFDEYLLGYRDRGAVLEATHAARVVPGSNGIFLPTLTSNGRVIGTWKRVTNKSGVRITLNSFNRLEKSAKIAFERAAARLGEFYGMKANLAAEE